MNETRLWWQNGVVYQIYPRSFADSNNDGIGDLQGVIGRLDYLAWLGIDAIWLSPIFPSPMADFGYDVSDYTGIHPLFGDLDDFDDLLAAAHQRKIRVLLDLVPNHSSDEHPWFIESRSSRENPYRDWYIWRDPQPDGSPPNNWQSVFGGPAWSLDEGTGQYYLHSFDPKQADLNWRNPAVRHAIYDAVRFWFDRGVDGFRIDVFTMIFKHPDLPDNPPNPNWKPSDPPQWQFLGVYNNNQPEVHGVARELRQIADAYPERVLIGELYDDTPTIVSYYGENLDEIHLPFNFQLVTGNDWSAETLRALIDRYDAAIPPGAWPNWVLSNHDQPRVASRLGPELSRLAHLLLLTLRGTPTIYYGDELGMENVPIPQAMVQDPQGIRTPGHSRDPYRTPMQWDASASAGFSTTRPWLPIAADYTITNVAVQRADPESMLIFVRNLLALRRSEAALHSGEYASVDAAETVLAYTRSTDERLLLVLLNLSEEPSAAELGTFRGKGTLLLGTDPQRSGTVDLPTLTLQAYEGLVIAL